jgi:hypothetical protein
MLDANLEHCKVTGRLAMGAIFMVQGTIVGHFSRRQSTVETAMYASKFIAGPAALDEIKNARSTFGWTDLDV